MAASSKGFYPMRAPLGYLDCGKAKPKVPDPATAPLIRYAFEAVRDRPTHLANHQSRPRRQGSAQSRRPATFGQRHLDPAQQLLLLRRRSISGAATRISTACTSRSSHARLFNRVQDALHGRMQRRAQKHRFTFARLITCSTCGYSLIGETHKGLHLLPLSHADLPNDIVAGGAHR